MALFTPHALPPERLLLAAAIVAAAVPLFVPRALLPRLLLCVVVVGGLLMLMVVAPPPQTLPAAAAPPPAKNKDANENDRGVLRRPSFASLDPELYTLRLPGTAELERDRRPSRGALRHLAFRGGGRLLSLVRRAARLGARNGNSASGARALAALEDFFARHHRAMLSPDADLAARTLEAMRDTRVVALNALQDLTLTVPIALAVPIRAACEAARIETQRCLAAVADLHSSSGTAPGLAAVASTIVAPAAHDPRREGAGGGKNLLF